MGYIFIIFSAITIATLFVYVLGNYVLGINLRWKPVLLCAVCSMVISLVLPHVVVGIAGLAGSMLLLALFSVICAFFVAKYDANHEKDRAGAAASGGSCLLSESEFNDVQEEGYQETAVANQDDIALQVNELEEAINEENSSDLEQAIEEDSGLMLHEPIVNDAVYPVQIVEQVVESSEADLNTSGSNDITDSKSVETEIRELISEQASDALTSVIEDGFNGVVIDELANKFEAAAKDEVAEEASSISTESIAEAEEEALTPVLTELINIENDITDSKSIETEIRELVSEQTNDGDRAVAANSLAAAIVGEEVMVTREIEENQTLDALMDYAFLQKEQEHYQLAFLAFRKALDLYNDSETAPFIVVEMGNILKNKGAYDEAIQIFSEGRNLPALQYDELLEQEFVSTIAYLRIVKNILLAQRLGFIPYNEIPGAVVEEINAEFCEWRKLA